MPNRLQHASSPYLRQHADNPVDWFEWGAEAFDQAKAQDRPVFLSVGYSSCHWCHVMAHESFEDERVAALLNERFVAIKVDREERPDIDSVYMNAVQALSGQGGWPMSVFLTPDGVPFFGGTYWPKEARAGLRSFIDVLDAVSRAWTEQREQLVEAGQRLAAHLRETQELGAAGAVDAGTPQRAAARCVSAWDRQLGGFGGAPKFPAAMTIDFLLAHHLRTGDDDALAAAVHSLEAMTRGGIYDHVGGGFHRYSVDARWLVPHFEKMLYDNALLLRGLVHARQVTGSARFRRVAIDVADYLLRELRHPEGGFYSATDADSEGEEGRFFVWTAAEFDEVVGAAGEDPARWRSHYGVVDGGNWRDPHGHARPGTNILHERGAPPNPLHERGAPPNPLHERGAPPFMQESAVAATGEESSEGAGDGFPPGGEAVRAALYARRAARVHPGLDDKVLTSWNALVIGALAEAGAVLDRPAYVAAAQDAARFLADRLVCDGGLRHTWKEGHGAAIPAFLEDVASLAQALLVLFEADGDARWLGWARALARDAEERFADGAGAYFTTASDAEQLLTRPRDLWDNATPGGASVMADVHLRLAGLTGEMEHLRLAERILGRFADRAEEAPTGHGELLRSIERLLAGPREVAVVTVAGDDASEALARVYWERWHPGAVLAVGEPNDPAVPLLRDRPLVDGAAAAYVCREFACERPVTTPAALRALLD